MPQQLPIVDLNLLRERVDSGSFSRGSALARTGGVIDIDWESPVIRSLVSGTVPGGYRCHIQMASVGGLWIPMTMACSCPVRYGCKHVVATLLTITERALADQAKALASAQGDDWRLQITDYLPEAKAKVPLALGFTLKAVSRSRASRWEPRGTEPTARDAIRGDGDLDLQIRPLRRGKSGNWIKDNLSWRGLAYRTEFDPAHLLWFSELLGLYDATRSGFAGVDHEGLSLTQVRSPLLWSLLQQAESHGIELVGLDRPMTVDLAGTATFDLHAEQDPETAPENGGGLRVRPRLLIEGTEIVDDNDESETGRVLRWEPIADHGIFTVDLGARQIRVGLAQLRNPLPPAVLSALEAVETLRIPEADVEEFLGEFYPRLANALEVTAEAGIELPETHPSMLLLRLAYGKDHRLKAAWSWRNGTHEYGLAPDAVGVGPNWGEASWARDAEHEAAVLRAVTAAWPGGTDPATQLLEGIETAEFTTGILPRLEKIEFVAVEIDGERPAYTHLTGNPHIKITTVESDRTDWFDLGFEITIDGRTIPFTNLFTALARGHDRLLLVDKSYLSLDHPAFDQLRELLHRAEEFTEWEPEQPQISRYQVDFWEEFEDLADETVEAHAWRTAMEGLRTAGTIEPVPTPHGLLATLRPYQAEGVAWLNFLWRNRLGGILADDMGLGKTVQTLALIAHLRETGGEPVGGRRPEDDAPFLVIAPTSVVGAWAQEAKKFTPGLKVVTISQTSAKRGRKLGPLIAGADAVITSYAIARLDADEFTRITWAGLICDEAQFLKNHATRAHREIAKIAAPFRLGITGTPMENSLTDLWSLTKITAPGLFPSGRRFREEYVRPIEKNNDTDRLAQLRRMVRPFMLRRTKEQVAADLPPKQEQILEVELNPEHRAIYDAVLQRERQKVLGLVDDLGRNRFIVFRSLTLLRMLALAPELVEPDHASVGSAKLDALMEQLADVAAEGHRALVFSQFTSFLKLAAARCEAAGLDYTYLDGSTTNRTQVIDSFREGSAPVFFISLKAGGFGLTLTEADYVFMLDPWWNPAAETQAVDRTHRIGQTKNVMVYRLVAADTIEDKVMALQRKKAALFSAVVDDDALFSKALSEEDIRGLFT